MAKVHRLLVERLGAPPADAVLLDSPYGFQENADDISVRTVSYFRNLQIPLDVASWRTPTSPAPRAGFGTDRRRRLHLRGPGSPTYALGVWRDSRLPDVLGDKLTRGGCVAFASAAALTFGVATVPVYEIYKVGATPYWARAGPAGADRRAGGGDPALRQRRGRHPRHPILLPRRATTAAAGIDVGDRYGRRRRGRTHCCRVRPRRGHRDGAGPGRTHGPQAGREHGIHLGRHRVGR